MISNIYTMYILNIWYRPALEIIVLVTYMYLLSHNSFLASSNFCRLLIIFANSLNPDQDQQNVGPDLDPIFLTLIVFLKEIFEIFNFE